MIFCAKKKNTFNMFVAVIFNDSEERLLEPFFMVLPNKEI